jgi:hypothetical protein
MLYFAYEEILIEDMLPIAIEMYQEWMRISELDRSARPHADTRQSAYFGEKILRSENIPDFGSTA